MSPFDGPDAHPDADAGREGFLAVLLERCGSLVAAGHRPVLGLNGPVGAGKSTLSRLLAQRARAQGLALAVASIDDAYRPWEERLAAMAGNPFGVNRVPPGSHDPALLVDAIAAWRAERRGEEPARLVLPRFDKRLHAGQGDRCASWCGAADALLLEGWLVGCRPLGPALAPALDRLEASGLEGVPGGLSSEERRWLPRWDRELERYQPLWDSLDALALLWPLRWELPRRWRLQAEARQRSAGGGWMEPGALQALVRASLASLPPALYLRPLLGRAERVMLLDGRRRCRWEGSGRQALSQVWAQASSPSSSATG